MVMNIKSIGRIVGNALLIAIAGSVAFFFWKYRPSWLSFFSETVYLIVCIWLGLSAWAVLWITDTTLRSDKDTKEKIVHQLETGGQRPIGCYLAFYYLFGLFGVSLIGFAVVGGAGTLVGSLIDRVVENGVLGEARTACTEFVTSSTPPTNELGKTRWVGFASVQNWEDDFENAESLDELDTVICFTQSEKPTHKCEYTGGVTAIANSQVWNVKVVDWKTKILRAEKTFQGGRAICPEKVDSSTRTIYGGEPSSQLILDWLQDVNSGGNEP
jgi:hypothetical protein